MDRLVALGKGCLATACLLALGCASRPVAPISTPPAFAAAATAAAVDAGPPCDKLQERIQGSEAGDRVRTGTWLDSPLRMVESRRVRALHVRAAALGCELPRT